MEMPNAQEPTDKTSHGAELRKEAYTMALYVSICLLAALTAPHLTEDIGAYKLVWGTTLGLAIAHWFAFRVSAQLVAAGKLHSHDADLSAAQLIGAAAVGALATIPIVLLDESVELRVVRLTLAGFIAVVGFAVARAGGASRTRSSVYGVSILIVAMGVAALKNFLAGH